MMGWTGPFNINQERPQRHDHRPIWWQQFPGGSPLCQADKNSLAQAQSTLFQPLRTLSKHTELTSDKAGIWTLSERFEICTFTPSCPDDSGRLPASKIDLLYESENNFRKYLLQMWKKIIRGYFLCRRRGSCYGKICEKPKKRLHKAKYNS